MKKLIIRAVATVVFTFTALVAVGVANELKERAATKE